MRKKVLLWVVGSIALVAAIPIVATSLDRDALLGAWENVRRSPEVVAATLLAYFLAFVVRAQVWTRTVPQLGFGHALSALHVSLAGNHVLPLRLGEALRVTDVVRRTGISLKLATTSTVVLRVADILAVVVLAAALGPGLLTDLVGPMAWIAPTGAAAIWVVGVLWLRRRRFDGMRIPVVIIAFASVGAWILESAVMWQAARWAGASLGIREAVLVTAVTIAAQAFAVAPGGLGTYEAAATAALVALGVDATVALTCAITAHVLKTLYSLISGVIALWIPAPGTFGRFRLPRAAQTPSPPRPASSSDPHGPVVLFMPAHNEQATVDTVVARVPAYVAGRRVVPVVVDDGSTDATAAAARAAGAEVIEMGTNHGLGAAVRTGLSYAVGKGAAAVAFCDADGEYAPEELERLISPILDGNADYVVGSRFNGTIARMLPHRRFGNKVLTLMLRLVTRRPISDGQSGYRAFSRECAASAEVIHDFNYAQVLTIDLLAKGFRYQEVPISYSFRETGHSFVRLGRYLRKVIPAIHRELNAPL
jgi:uncharacterized membrane protein YbhN (UPF0104 family)